MSDAGQEAARRWPQAVNSRNESTYPTAALYEFSRSAFVAGAEWQAGQDAEAMLGRIRALVAGELGAAGSVQAVRAIREILGELPGRVATCSHDGGIWPGMSTCADCGAEVEIVTPGDPS